MVAEDMGRGNGALMVRGALRGLLAGVVGVTAMTAGEKREQVVTNRPNSYVPAHTLICIVGDRSASWLAAHRRVSAARLHLAMVACRGDNLRQS